MVSIVGEAQKIIDSNGVGRADFESAQREPQAEARCDGGRRRDSAICIDLAFDLGFRPRVQALRLGRVCAVGGSRLAGALGESSREKQNQNYGKWHKRAQPRSLKVLKDDLC